MLRRLFSSENPNNKTYAEHVVALKLYFEPSGNITETYKFYKAEQWSKSVREFMVELKHMAEKCKFESYLNRALRDKFVCGIRDNQLHSKSGLTFKKACEIALNWVMAEGVTKQIYSKEEAYNTCAVRQGHGRSRSYK